MTAETHQPASVPPVVHDQLRRLVDATLTDISGAVHATLVVEHPDGWEAVVATDADAEVLAAIERSTGGPSQATLRSGRISRMPSTTRPATWPEFARACQRHGVHSVAAFPVVAAGQQLGALTIASNDHFGFGKEETHIATEAATHAAQILQARPSQSV